MKDNKKQYWKGLEELNQDPVFVEHANKEFPQYLPTNGKTDSDTGMAGSRRDFLKLMGFGVAAATLAACEAPVRKAIPYLNKPADIDPGKANFYASTYSLGGDYCGVVVKTREGRPIKIEGNKLCPITQGGLSAQVEASVLSLYDNERLKNPLIKGKKVTWADVDKEVKSKLTSIANSGAIISIVSNTILSPSTKAVIADFKAKYPTAEHITYDTNSASGMKAANKATFGKAIVPSYDFSKASVVVSFDADFLGTWISPIEYTKQYSKTRKLGRDKKEMSRHYHFESNMSLTGANADYRTKVKPSAQGLLVMELYNAIAKKAGASTYKTGMKNPTVTKAAKDLWAARGKSLVVAGSNDAAIQTVVNSINELLGNYGKTIDIDTALNFRQGSDRAMNAFVRNLNTGKIGAVVFLGANPVYNHPKGAAIVAGLKKAKLSVSTASALDETAAVCGVVAPDHHYLESWNDASPKTNMFSLAQPMISPLFDTRQAQNSLLNWSGSDTDYYNYLRNYWKMNLYSSISTIGFDTFWDKTLYDGVYSYKTTTIEEVDSPIVSEEEAQGFRISQAVSKIGKTYTASSSGFELAIYQKIGLGDGTQANNPWLQEMPDPITKSTWENYVTISQADAKTLGAEMSAEGNTVFANVKANGATLKVPVMIQPGQASGTLGVAVGYGRVSAGKVANGLGANAFQAVGMSNETANYNVTSGVTITLTEETTRIARTQTHQTMMGRAIVQESVLSAYKKDPTAGRRSEKVSTFKGKKGAEELSLWDGHEYTNHHWGLVVDLNSCTGCSACTISCQAENNIPVVGKEEVLNRREMHWMRIDRYYSHVELAEDVGMFDRFSEMENPSDNPEVVFQPLMCQHCDNAPCETVCPVAATTHSTEGLNQMAYNRCIGTRYCANNCPYKVRRFNWFKYHDNEQFTNNTSMNNNLGKMVLNPDVTVRSRGVMEKCSLCVQRIQAGKLEAKGENRRPIDGEISVACASSCPADALIFGDMNDMDSKISKLLATEEKERAYHLLEEINVRPNVSYLVKIRNKDVDSKEA